MSNKVVNAVTGCCAKMKFGVKKYSPEILMVAGITGMVTGAVMACKATMKVNDILEDAKEKLDDIHESTAEVPEIKKQTTAVYVQTGLKFAKLYAPAVVIGGLSITSILASNNILKKRNVALAAAYATVDKGFKEYRARVVERFGEQVDNEILHNLQPGEIEETIVDEKGKEKQVKTPVLMGDDTSGSCYARYFDRHNPCWNPSTEYNEFYLNSQQNYANDRLKANGYITLNEVYEMLGMEPTKAGMVVGWIYDPKNNQGDNFVQFDVQKVYVKPDEYSEVELKYLIDFNVDGNIYNRVDE